MKYTQATLDKIENIIEESGYIMIAFNKNTVRSRYSYFFVLLIAFCTLLEGIIRVFSLGFLFNFDALTYESQQLYGELLHFEKETH